LGVKNGRWYALKAVDGDMSHPWDEVWMICLLPLYQRPLNSQC